MLRSLLGLLILGFLATLCYGNDQLLRELIEKDIDTDDDSFVRFVAEIFRL